jgi:hypothetical protein
MSDDKELHIDGDSAELKAAVEVCPSFTEDIKSSQAGTEPGEELKDESERKEPASDVPLKEPATPLFLRDSSEGKKGNAQDEKDWTAE